MRGGFTVLTMDTGRTVATMVAPYGNHIVAVGRRPDSAGRIGPDTKRSASSTGAGPAWLIDAHIHLVLGAERMAECAPAASC